MTIRIIAAGLALALAVGGCSGPADPAPGAGAASASKPAQPGGPKGPKGPKPPANPMAGAVTYECYDGSQLHVVFDATSGTARVRLDDDEMLSLPREQKADLEAYTDGNHTLGVSKSGDLAYTETPAPPKVCRLPPPDTARDAVKDQNKDNHVASDKAGSKDHAPAADQPASGDRPASTDLPAPKAGGVLRNFTAADKGKTIEMKVGEKVSISLVGIPTAGYVWAADTTPSCVKVTDGPSGPTISAQNQPGYTGGNHWEVLVVEAVKAGDGDLVLAMRRPWEKKSDPDAETFNVKVKVKVKLK